MSSITISLIPNNIVRISGKNSELFLDDREMVIKFGVKIPKDLIGSNDSQVTEILSTFIYDYNNSLVLKDFFHKRTKK